MQKPSSVVSSIHHALRAFIAGVITLQCATAYAQCEGAVLSHRGGSAVAVTRLSSLLCGVFGDELVIHDVSSIDNPVQRGRLVPPGGDIAAITSDDSHVYMIGRLGLIIVNPANPDNPVLNNVFSEVTTGNSFIPKGVVTSNDVVYIADGYTADATVGEIHVVDVSSHTHPWAVTRFDVQGFIYGLALDGDLLCVATSEGVKIYDVSVPANPVRRSTFQRNKYAWDVALRGTTMYCVNEDLSTQPDLYIVDVSNPDSPSIVGSTPVYTFADTLAINPAGTAAFVGAESPDPNSAQIECYDISNPASPQARDVIAAANPRDLFASANTLFSANGKNGLKAWNTSNLNSTSVRWILGFVPEQPTYLAASDSRVVVADGSELEVLNTTTAGAPTTMTRVVLTDVITGVCITNNIACVIDASRTLTIVDLDAPGVPVAVGSISTVDNPTAVGAFYPYVCVGTDEQTLEVFTIVQPSTPVRRGVVTGLIQGPPDPIHDVELFGPVAIVSQNSLWSISLLNPNQPQIVGTTGSEGGGDIAIHPPYVYSFNNGYRIDVFDFSLPATPVLLHSSFGDYPDAIAAWDTILAVYTSEGRIIFYDTASTQEFVEIDAMEAGEELLPRMAVGGGRLWIVGTPDFDDHATGLWEVHIPSAPRVLVNPADLRVDGDTNALFSVSAAEPPLTYQWLHDGQPLVNGPTGHGSVVLGALSDTLSILSADREDAGNYSCVITNACGDVSTRTATLTVIAAGDMNCDGLLNNFDINPFVLALTDQAAFETEFPDCDYLNADVDGNSLVNNFDIDPFVLLLAGG